MRVANAGGRWLEECALWPPCTCSSATVAASQEVGVSLMSDWRPRKGGSAIIDERFRIRMRVCFKSAVLYLFMEGGRSILGVS